VPSRAAGGSSSSPSQTAAGTPGDGAPTAGLKHMLGKKINLVFRA